MEENNGFRVDVETELGAELVDIINVLRKLGISEDMMLRLLAGRIC